MIYHINYSRCSANKCSWRDYHRPDPACANLETYCNIRVDGEGNVIKNYDDLASPVPTNVPGGEIKDRKEPRHIAMRLLYSTHSNTVTDPRVQARDGYPRVSQQSDTTTCIGIDGWRLFSWSRVDKVNVKSSTSNPHIESELMDEIVII